MIRIEIKGTIVSDSDIRIYDYFEIPACCPSRINKALSEAKGQDIEVIINSGGGSVFAGSEIYSSLKDYSGYSIGKIVGMAASAASVISMGTNKLLMSPTAQFMIHNASTCSGGNKNDLNKDAKILDTIDKSIANAYKIKTGLNQKELLRLMDKETWLTAQEAKEKGFIDEIMFSEGIDFSNSITNHNGNGTVIPQAIINKLKNEKISLKNDEEINCLKHYVKSHSDFTNNNTNKKQKLKLQLDLI